MFVFVICYLLFVDGDDEGGANNDGDSVNFHLPKLITVKAGVFPKNNKRTSVLTDLFLKGRFFWCSPQTPKVGVFFKEDARPSTGLSLGCSM